MRLETNPRHPEPRNIGRAVEVLRGGGVLAYPTDTVYGLGADMLEKKAIKRIYQMKGMDEHQPMAFLCPDLSDIARYALIEDRDYRLMRRLLPGPYCFILRATKEVPRMLMMKLKTVGIRVPNHPVTLALIKELGRPIVSTSAVYKGETLNDPADIAQHFKQVDLILDVGYGSLEPSTVIDLTREVPVIVREGAGSIEAFV